MIGDKIKINPIPIPAFPLKGKEKSKSPVCFVRNKSFACHIAATWVSVASMQRTARNNRNANNRTPTGRVGD